MCHDPSGSDAAITPSSFEINYGWNYGPHRYDLEIAPRVVSWLLDASGTRGEPDVRAVIEPTDIPRVQGYPAWQMPALHVALRADHERVTIRVRDTAVAL